MGLLRSALRAESSGLATPEKWLIDWFRGGIRSAAGVDVTEDKALDYSAFFAGVKVIAEDVASLPLHVYERLEPRGKRRAVEHPLYPVLHEQPNPLMTAVELRELLQQHGITWGNGLANIVFDSRGNVTELWPLRPDRTKPEVRRRRLGRTELWYIYTDPVNDIKARIPADEVLHLKGIGGDALWGWSMVQRHRNAIGLGIATEAYGSTFFRNGARPGGVLKHPGELSPRAKKGVKEDFEAIHRGLDNAQRVAILEEGLTWEQTGIPNEDAQFIGTREFQVQEIARILRLPPHKLSDLSRATFSNIEHQALDYVVSTLRPWLVRWEQAFAARLFSSSERRRWFAEHVVEGLLRGDIKTRYEAYRVGREMGWLNGDDVRELENMNPLPDGQGQVYLVPLNMVPAPKPGEDPGEPPRTGGRVRRSAESRRNTAERFRAMVEDVDRRIARMEQAEVGSLVRRHLEDRGRSSADFLQALEPTYESIRERARDRWRPLIASMAAAIAADAAADIDLDDAIDLDDRTERFAGSYTSTHVGYQVATSLAVLRSLAEDPEPAAAVTGRLDDWVSERPARTARQHTVQLPEAVAREVWRAGGVRRMRWVARGSDTCEFCRSLDGRVVGVEEPFLPTGGEIPGSAGGLTSATDVFHPPAHDGCVCSIDVES